MCDIVSNKEVFCKILKYAENREGLDEITKMLNRTDFFEAPASMKYHSPYPGGLVQHTLNVYKNMLDFIKAKALTLGLEITHIIEMAKVGEPLDLVEKIKVDKEGVSDEVNSTEGVEKETYLQILNKAISLVLDKGITLENVVIVSLLHDCHKINFYESYQKSIYKGVDDRGRKIWGNEEVYKIREDALVYGEPGSTSNYIINSYMKLTYKEMLAIENHHGFGINGTSLPSASKAWNFSKLAICLHLADMEAAYYTETTFK